MGAKKKAKREARKEEREYLFALVQQRVEERDTAWELNATQADTIGDLQKELETSKKEVVVQSRELYATKEALSSCESKLYYTELQRSVASKRAEKEFERYQAAQQEVEATRAAWDHANKDVGTLRNDLTAALEYCRDLRNELAERPSIIQEHVEYAKRLENELANLQNAHANQVTSIKGLQSQVATAEQEAAAPRVALGLALKENRCLGEVVEARGQEIAALLKKLKDRETYYEECLFRSHQELSRVLDESFVVDARLRTARALIANLHAQLRDKGHHERTMRRIWAANVRDLVLQLCSAATQLEAAHEKIAQLQGDEK